VSVDARKSRGQIQPNRGDTAIFDHDIGGSATRQPRPAQHEARSAVRSAAAVGGRPAATGEQCPDQRKPNDGGATRG
jgi:hypothetical protein